MFDDFIEDDEIEGEEDCSPYDYNDDSEEEDDDEEDFYEYEDDEDQ